MYYYSGTTGGFYLKGTNDPDSLPDDAIEISDERYRELWEGLSAGKVLVVDGVGAPVLVDPAPPTAAELSAVAKATRDSLLGIAAIRIAPLQDATDLGEATAAEASSLTAWKRYRVLLNRIEQQAGYPQAVEWPESPPV